MCVVRWSVQRSPMKPETPSMPGGWSVTRRRLVTAQKEGRCPFLHGARSGTVPFLAQALAREDVLEVMRRTAAVLLTLLALPASAHAAGRAEAGDAVAVVTPTGASIS